MEQAAEPASSGPDKARDRQNSAAAAGRRDDHRAGAQLRAVPRHGDAGHGRPAALGRRRAAGGARAAPGRHPACSAIPRSPTRPPIDMHRMGTVANVVRYITGAGRHASSRLPGRAALPGPRVPERLAVPGRARAAHSGTDDAHARDRGALAAPARPGAGGARAAAAGAARNWSAPCRRSTSRGALADLIAGLHGHRRRRRSRRSSRPSTSPRAWTRCSQAAGAPHRGAAAVAPRSASRPRRRSTSVSARCCCASRWRRSRRSSAKARKARPRRSPSSTRRSPKPACRRRSRTQARKELRRLQRMPEAPAEYGMVRTYLDWLIELPWTLPEEAPIDIAEARRILDEDHFGLDKIKRRILEYPRRAQARARRARRRSCASSALPASARPRSASRSRAPWAASSCACRSAACTTRPRSAATGAPISARCPATSSRASARRARATA